MSEVLIPPASGVASAAGLLVAPSGFDFGHSFAGELDHLDWTAVERLYAEMEGEGRRMVAAAGARGEAVRVERRAEMRYAGQFHDIEIAVPSPLPGDTARDLRTRFDGEYARLHGVTLDGYPVQALNWRVLVAADAPEVSIRVPGRGGNGAPPARRRALFLPGGAGFTEVPVYRRYDLSDGAVVPGPAVVEEAEATTLLWPRDTLTVDRGQNLVITIGVAEAAVR
jgi:N-methylhydantoinase A/oxoprolinase/acetone carboxylase beta subunit